MWEYPGFDPIALQLGPLAVRWYGLSYLVGIGGAWWLARRRAARPGAVVTPVQVDDLVFYVALGVILGGRLGYMFFYGFDQLLANPLNLLRIWEGGMSFHGGLLGVIVAFLLYARKIGAHVVDVADFSAPMVPVGLGCGRLGNFINGELWGKPGDGPFTMLVRSARLPPESAWGVDQVCARFGVAPCEIRLYPTQLVEAFLEGLVLFTLLWLFSARPRPRFAVAALFLLAYGVFRFGVEFLRMPDAHLGYLAFGWVTMGQVLTLPMILVGAGGLIWAYRRGGPGALPARQGA
jgi:phosphatidylglycerol---prolipoprotein diacylglyceryl transferase